MGVAVVSELVSRRRHLTRDLRIPTYMHTALEEGSPDILTIQVLKDVQSTLARPVVKGDCHRSTASRATVHRRPEDLRGARESSICGSGRHSPENPAGRYTR